MSFFKIKTRKMEEKINKIGLTLSWGARFFTRDNHLGLDIFVKKSKIGIYGT